MAEFLSYTKKSGFPKLHGGAHLRFCSPQPDTGLHCETMDTDASAWHGVSGYSPAVRLVPISQGNQHRT